MKFIPMPSHHLASIIASKLESAGIMVVYASGINGFYIDGNAVLSVEQQQLLNM